MRTPSLIGLAVVLLALAGCQSPPGADPVPVAGSPATPAAADDTCGAASYAWLIGENRSRIPATPAGKTVRVVCSTCAMTMDFNAERLTIVFDEDSGIVSKLNCG